MHTYIHTYIDIERGLDWSSANKLGHVSGISFDTMSIFINYSLCPFPCLPIVFNSYTLLLSLSGRTRKNVIDLSQHW